WAPYLTDEVRTQARLGPDLIGEVRGPVAVAPDQRRVDPAPVELAAQSGQQGSVLVIDRRLASEAEVVLPHLLESLLGDPAAGSDVAKEGNNFFWGLRSSE